MRPSASGCATIWPASLPQRLEGPEMCGIVGYVGHRPCRELLLRGLERLEYRGYDSAGLSLLADGQIQSVRAVGNLSYLRAAVTSGPTQQAPTASAVALAD